jgi:dihydrolipoamide dehydrogenase
VCLNEGCIPSKTLLNSAKIFDYTKAYGQKYGVYCEGSRIDFGKVIDRKNKVVKTLVGGVAFKLQSLKVDVVNDHGVIEDRTDEGYGVRVGDTVYRAPKLLIATGSSTLIPPIPGAKEALEAGILMTNREILDLREPPAEMIVIGGGVIGLEMASVFNSVGTKVTVVEMLDKIAGPTDREISAILQKNYSRKGIKFVLGAKVTKIDGKEVTYELNGEPVTISADKILMSVGRRANTANIGLEKIGVQVERGAIVTEEQMKTNLPGVFAAGDVNGKMMLAHTAYRETEVAINNILGIPDKMNYNAIPSVIYTNPEVAGVGETIDTATAKGMKVREVSISMRYSGRYVAENEGGDGIAKLVLEEGTNRLVGVHMIGNPCSEIIVSMAMALELEVSLDALKKVVFPHPSVSEIIREAIFSI